MSICGWLGKGLVALALLGWAGLAQAQAQLGHNLPGLPEVPSPPNPVEIKRDCSPSGIAAMERQLEQLEQVGTTTPETIGLFCAGLEMIAKLMDWKDDEPLPAAINDLAKEILKQNITPRMIKAMCRQTEGEAGRNIRTEIGQVKAKLQSCKGV